MTGPATYALVAVVLAGGESRRFGSDKLAADLNGRTVLDRALDGLPPGTRVAVVGPHRAISREVTFLREEPPGGGPGAGLIAGLGWALEVGAEQIVVLPGDAPGAGRAAQLLLAALAESARPSTPTASTSGGSAAAASADSTWTPGSSATRTTAAVGTDRAGREQVLQLALRPSAARLLIEAAGPGQGRGQSVRRLLSTLTPAPRPVPLPDDLTRDIDTTDELRRWLPDT